jgi:hypothetical protein
LDLSNASVAGADVKAMTTSATTTKEKELHLEHDMTIIQQCIVKMSVTQLDAIHRQMQTCNKLVRDVALLEEQLLLAKLRLRFNQRHYDSQIETNFDNVFALVKDRLESKRSKQVVAAGTSSSIISNATASAADVLPIQYYNQAKRLTLERHIAFYKQKVHELEHQVQACKEQSRAARSTFIQLLKRECF